MNPDFADINLPWPAPGDRLVVDQGPNWQFRAWIAKRGDFHAYIEGYRRAAEALWEHIVGDPRLAGVDYLVYPMVFIYRHFVELSLKDVIASGRYLTVGIADFPKHHELASLWREAKRLIEQIEPEGSKEDLQGVQDLIHQLHAIDEGSFAFRYPLDKSSKVTLAGHDYLDIQTFHSGMGKLANFFEGCRCQFDVYRENIGE